MNVQNEGTDQNLHGGFTFKYASQYTTVITIIISVSRFMGRCVQNFVIDIYIY